MMEVNEQLFHNFTANKTYKRFVTSSMKKDMKRIGLSSCGCVITQNGAEDELYNETQINHDFVDITGYEMFKNEWNYRNGLLSCSRKKQIRLLMMRMRVLRDYLQDRFPEKRFVIIGLICKNETQVRFHEKRDNESWLTKDIDKYEEGTLVLY